MAHEPEDSAAELILELNPDLDLDLLNEFLNDARDHLDNIEQGVLVLEENSQNHEVIHTIFRAFHTFKGNAGFLELIPINKLAHILESLLDLARDNRMQIDSTIIEIILKGRDTLKRFIDEIDNQLKGKSPRQNILIPTAELKQTVSSIIARYENPVAPTIAPAPVAPPAPVLQPTTPELVAPVAAPEVEPAARKASPKKASTKKTSAQTKVTAEIPAPEIQTAPFAIAPVSEPVPSPTSVAHAIADAPPLPSANPTLIPSASPATPAKNNTPATPAENTNAIKVSTAKLDGLVDLVGELVIVQSLIVQNISSGESGQAILARNLSQMDRISKDIQRTAMSMRMVPIRSTFQKMHRLMRDVAARQKKEVQLVLSGEDTEIDRTIVEKISDPLMHMIRNGVDHGMELPEQRVAAGKPALGTIYLRAAHKSGNIVIEVEDDGAGLNRDRIIAKAKKVGLLNDNSVIEDKDIYALIFHPGFSTAQTVTDISGRGVGMDVVQKNITRLRGKIDISSVYGQGTRFTIQLPLTLAIIDGLIVRVGDQRYILPATSVRESLHSRNTPIINIPGRGEFVQIRQEVIPLLRLNQYFQMARRGAESIFVVIESDNEKRCLLVDELVGKQEIVIKNLGEVFRMEPIVAGGTILGDGCVGVILDPAAILKLPQSSGPEELPQAVAA